MRCEVVLVFAWVAVASGSAWQEPLLGAVKIPSAELDRLSKEVQLVAHKELHCFQLLCGPDYACGFAGVFGQGESARP